MTLLFMDGFDHYATADIAKKWLTASGSIVAGSGRRGGGALQNPSTSVPAKNIPDSSTVIFGAALYLSGFGTQTYVDFYDSTGVGVQLQVGFTASGGVYVNRGGSGAGFGPPGGTLLGASAGGVVPLNSFFYIEVKATIHDTTGSVEVRLNGSATPVLLLTNVDTKNTANAFINMVRLGNVAGGPMYVDDLYICDTLGSRNNDFLGDVRIDAYYPNADGANSGLTPSTGTTHYTLVDESTPNTTDYNQSSTVGAVDTYQMADMSHVPSNIYAVQLNVAALKDDAGARSVKPVVRSGGTNYGGATTALSTSVQYYRDIRETDPATAAAWTATNVNAAEFGAEVV